MKVYNGSTWVDSYATLSGALIATNKDVVFKVAHGMNP